MALQFLAGTSKSDKKVEEKVKLFHTVHYGDENYERKKKLVHQFWRIFLLFSNLTYLKNNITRQGRPR